MPKYTAAERRLISRAMKLLARGRKGTPRAGTDAGRPRKYPPCPKYGKNHSFSYVGRCACGQEAVWYPRPDRRLKRKRKAKAE